jgi:predicted DNA-binding protein YlxM (UPF0122 family)
MQKIFFSKTIDKSRILWYTCKVICFTPLSDGGIMFEKNMKIAYLIDFYGDALDDHTGEVLRAYYNDDLSLAEIAADEGISRQGVRHLIKKGEDQLIFFEERFGLAARHRELSAVCRSLSDIRESLLSKGDFADEANGISDAIRIILKGSTDVSESD